MTYRDFIIETYVDSGDTSFQKVRARPLPGQGVSTDLNVACSLAMRENYPRGTLFKVECVITNREGMTPLYRHHSWPYIVVNKEEAEQFLKSFAYEQ